MKTKDLIRSLKATAEELLHTAKSLEHMAVINLKSDPQQFKLVIPLGMFAGVAIDTLELKTAPRVVYVGECRMGGVDYSSVRLTIAEPFSIDESRWALVGDNTLVWSE